MEKLSGNAEFSSANVELQAVVEFTSDQVLEDMQRFVRGAAGKPDGWGSNVKLAITLAARRMGMNYREAKGWWYRELAEPTVSKYSRVRARYEALCEREAGLNKQEDDFLMARIERVGGYGRKDADSTDLDGGGSAGDC